MNKIGEDIIDLRHDLASTSDRIETKSNTSSSGAGVNASSRVDMAFATSDTLSELVWSPRNGLSLKCADSSLAENKPFILWDVGPSTYEVSTSQSIRSKGIGDDKVEVEEKLYLKQGSLNEASYELDAHGICCDAGRTDNTEEEDGTSDAIWKEENPNGNGEHDLCSSKNVQIMDIAEGSQKVSEKDTLADVTCEIKKISTAINWQPSAKRIRRTRTRCNRNNRVEVNVTRSDIIGSTNPILSESHTDQNPLEDLVRSLPEFRSPWEPGDGVTSASADVDKNKKTWILTKLESSSENDMVCLSEKVARNSHRSPTDSGVHLYQENGKEKALSNGDKGESSSNSENDSMESCCNGAGLSSIKRWNNDELQLVGSKRLKRPVSSFMNWISNMVKGSNKEESCSPTLDLTRSNKVCFANNKEEHLMCSRKSGGESPNMGFQTMFRSLYCRDTKMSEFGLQRDNHSRQESKDLLVANESEGNNVKNSCKEIVLCDDQECPHKLRIFASTPYAFERSLAGNKTSDVPFYGRGKAADDTSLNISSSARCMPEKRNPSASLWITRLYTRLENCKQITDLNTTLEEEMPRFDAKTSCVHFKKSADQTTQIEFPQKLPNSEAMASVFAKRLDALRHIEDTSEKAKSSLLCFKEKQKCDFVKAHNGFPHEEMFHAVRRLHLSRADILRWMNSDLSLLHLNGFFLRLRVGKLEARVGGTGYYVARIAGDTVGNIGCNSEKSILVDVGGIKSSVGSQFVSNHDFLEDEIKDWWSRIETTGGKIPSLDELKSKFKDKTCLGF